MFALHLLSIIFKTKTMSKKLIKKVAPKKLIIIGKKPTKTAKAKPVKSKTVKTEIKKTKPAVVAESAPVKPVAKKAKAKSVKAKKTTPVAVKSAVETPVIPNPDFTADLAKSESVAATTIETKEFTRTRRTPVADAPVAQDDIAELNRIIDKVMHKRGRTVGGMRSHDIKSYILKLNPNVGVRIEHPRPDVKSQSKFHITVGNETGTVPVLGWLSTNG